MISACCCGSHDDDEDEDEDEDRSCEVCLCHPWFCLGESVFCWQLLCRAMADCVWKHLYEVQMCAVTRSAGSIFRKGEKIKLDRVKYVTEFD